VNRRRTATLLLVLTGALLAFAGGGAPAGAIETTSFGLDVAEPTDDGRLHLELRAGETTTGQVKVWNKTEAPLVLQLSVAPARIAEDGTVSLGGDDAAVGWVDLEPARVELPAGGERVVEVKVEAPRKLTGDVRAVAIQAEPAAADPAAGGGEQPAVIQRLALTTYLEPDEDSLIASLGPYPWIALAILVAVVAATVRSRRKRTPAQ
jgi:hypothetical protein